MTRAETKMKEMLDDHMTTIEEAHERRAERKVFPMFLFGVMVGLIAGHAPVGYFLGILSGFFFAKQCSSVSDKVSKFFLSQGNYMFALTQELYENRKNILRPDKKE